mgnify:CR=1 FL=1
MYFCKRRRTVPRNITLNNYNIQWVEQYKYLGIIFDSHLSWTAHIDYLTVKASQGLNVLKSITKVWWGSDPKILLLVYKGIIRSHLEFGTQCIFKTSKANWHKLNKMQYQSLRAVMGHMKSTPIRAILAETGETPLDIRRIWLISKYLLKTSSLIPNRIQQQILEFFNIYNENQANYWTRYATPAIIDAFNIINPFQQYLYRSDQIPCYNFPYQTQVKNINFNKTNLKKQINNEIHFAQFLKKNYSTHKVIYTDASVNPENKTCGIGIYCPQPEIQISRRITDYTPICTAETLAIREAIRTMGHQTNQFLIVSDSLSALQSIAKQGLIRNNDYITLSTRQEFLTALSNGREINLIWVPSHTGIKGNEKADALALRGRLNENVTQVNLLKYEAFFPQIKKHLWEMWKDRYQNWPSNSGQYYKDIQPYPLKTPWFKYGRYKNRIKTTMISKMRTNHCCTPLHLNKI